MVWSLVTAPIFSLFTWIYDQLGANSQKQPTPPEINTDDFIQSSLD